MVNHTWWKFPSLCVGRFLGEPYSFVSSSRLVTFNRDYGPLFPLPQKRGMGFCDNTLQGLHRCQEGWSPTMH